MWPVFQYGEIAPGSQGEKHPRDPGTYERRQYIREVSIPGRGWRCSVAIEGRTCLVPLT